jgi:hypothetical protein
MTDNLPFLSTLLLSATSILKIIIKNNPQTKLVTIAFF